MIDVKGNKELQKSIFQTFYDTGIDNVVEKVSVALNFGYFKTGVDYLNGLIASCSFVQAYYLSTISK